MSTEPLDTHLAKNLWTVQLTSPKEAQKLCLLLEIHSRNGTLLSALRYLAILGLLEKFS